MGVIESLERSKMIEGELNIHDIVLEHEKERKKSFIDIDPEKEISGEDWEKIVDILK